MLMGFLTRWARAVIDFRRLRADQRGATIVELAFAGPIVILITLGAVKSARAIFAQAAITQAVKETAQFASVRGAASGASATVDELEAMALQLADLSDHKTQVAVAWSPNNRPGSMVTITMQHDFEPLTTPFDGSTFTFNATASMTIVR